MKNTIKAITLTAVLAFGSNMAMADGIIIGDRAGSGCTIKAESEGIIIGDRMSGITAGILAVLEGIIIGDRGTGECKESSRDGIIIGDRDGIIIGD